MNDQIGLEMARLLTRDPGLYRRVRQITAPHWRRWGEEGWTIWLLNAITGTCKDDPLGCATCALRDAIKDARQ